MPKVVGGREGRPEAEGGEGAASNFSVRRTRWRSGGAMTCESIEPPKRAIPSATCQVLWGRAAGRCEFRGCNKPLWKSQVTQEVRVLGQHAHIRAFSTGGPRAKDDWPKQLLHAPENLMLLCGACHRTIDSGDGPERYSAQQLEAMKLDHERRIEVAGAVAPEMASHVVVYGTKIGVHQPTPVFADARNALFPLRYPAESVNINLGTPKSPYEDGSQRYWEFEREQLAKEFERRVGLEVREGRMPHVSVFALAPQPLLIQLGVHLGDITAVDVYQRHREPVTWSWPMNGDVLGFVVEEPTSPVPVPALVFSVSGTITDDRVTGILGPDVAIWRVSVPVPHNDVVKSRATQQQFRTVVRRVLDDIKARHGADASVHVFPALPCSLAVELGRVRMPKTDLPLVIYDERHSTGGFQRAFIISSEE